MRQRKEVDGTPQRAPAGCRGHNGRLGPAVGRPPRHPELPLSLMLPLLPLLPLLAMPHALPDVPDLPVLRPWPKSN